VHGPLHVRGAICLVNSVNERDLGSLLGPANCGRCLLEGTGCAKQQEAPSDNRSVMPLDGLGCTRDTMVETTSWCTERFIKAAISIVLGTDHWNLVSNQEFLVSVLHYSALTTSLLFVHTARRCFRLSDLVRCLDAAHSLSGRRATNRVT